MTPLPDFNDFARRYTGARAQVVWTSLVADLETPVSAMLKLAEGRPYSFLLESVTGGEIRGRYSLIGMKPDLVWRCYGDRVEVNRDARHDLKRFEPLRRQAAGRAARPDCREPDRTIRRTAARWPPACSAS